MSLYSRLMLQFDISDVTREGVGVCCQLMVGQSSVPHYQHLEKFTARLAPGEVSLLLCMHIKSVAYTVFAICTLVLYVVIITSVSMY